MLSLTPLPEHHKTRAAKQEKGPSRMEDGIEKKLKSKWGTAAKIHRLLPESLFV
jgi:hypothetical protein